MSRFLQGESDRCPGARAPLCVAVSGINAVDNPGPGLGVIRSLKESPDLDVKSVGLAYDAMEPGIYMDWLVDRAFVLPYPSVDSEDFLARLAYIKECTGTDVLVPTLDVELPVVIRHASRLAEHGIRTFLPTEEQYELRAKTRLDEVAGEIGLEVPETRAVTSHEDLARALDAIGLPVMIKGLYYKAMRAASHQEAARHFDAIASEWGYPIIVQRIVHGDELNVVGVGDGRGGHLGLLAIKKLWVTSLGKIWTGVTVHNEGVLEAARKFVAHTGWRGAFELECIKVRDRIYLIEINPRFPAWVYFATGAGMNLPARLVQAALGRPVDSASSYPAGKMFVRYTFDIVTDMDVLSRISTRGER